MPAPERQCLASQGCGGWSAARRLSGSDAAKVAADQLSDEALEVAMAPITTWCDDRLELEEFTELANACLDGTADQWETLRVVLELAEIKPQPNRKS